MPKSSKSIENPMEILPEYLFRQPLESVSLKWSIFIGIFQNLEKMSPKYMKIQGNQLKIVYKSVKNAQNPQKWTISLIHFLEGSDPVSYKLFRYDGPRID